MLPNYENTSLKIESLNQLLKDTDILLKVLTDIFMDNFNDFNIPQDTLILIQMYIVSLNTLIPELKGHLRLMEKGVYNAEHFTKGTIELMISHVNETKNQFKNLVKLDML